MSAVSTIPEVGSLIRYARKTGAKTVTRAKTAGLAVFTLALWTRLGSLLIALLILGMVLAGMRLARFARWASARRRKLAAAKLPEQSVRALWAAWRTEGRRLKLITDRWDALCRAHGLVMGGQTPRLVNHRADLDGNVLARMVRTMNDPEDVKAKAHKLAKALGCHSITVRELPDSPNVADLSFLWSDPLRKLLPLRDLPVSDHGRISYGVTASGEPATLEADLSTIFAGVTGSGKSNAALAALADLIRKGEPVRLYISNPKQTEMRAFKALEGQRVGNLEVRQYAETEDESKTLIANFNNAMNTRNSQIKGRKLTTPTLDNPRCILWLDELLWLPPATFKGTGSALGKILAGGRSSMFTVFACTQLLYSSDLGSIKGLFSQRVALRTTSEAITNTILGEGSTLRGAACHRLHKSRDRGIGFAADEAGDLSRFRAAHVTDADLTSILSGLVPEGMKLHADAEPEDEPQEAVWAILRRWAAAAWAKLTAWGKSVLIGAAVAVDGLR